MKCTNKIALLLVCPMLLIGGCGSNNIPLSYEKSNSVSVTELDSKAISFASELAVTNEDVAALNGAQVEEGSAGGLIDVNGKEVLYAKDIHKQMYPASLTKVLTALVALKYGNLDDVITCTDNVTKLESGATTCGLKSGDMLTLEQALHFLLLPSANDAAVAIAEHIGGSVEGFSEMMNEEAVALGATNSNFVNPHGLNNEEHYTTAYDMYLITNEAIKYDKFNEIINLTEYEADIRNSEGESRTISVKSSNKFLDGSYESPAGITVIGGKTGTTAAAGSCLILETLDSKGNPYISIIMKASERDLLYQEMISILEDINQR